MEQFAAINSAVNIDFFGVVVVFCLVCKMFKLKPKPVSSTIQLFIQTKYVLL